MKTANDAEFISDYNNRMVEYLDECLNEGHINQKAYDAAIIFWNRWRALYDHDLDCAPSASGVLLALDDGCNHCEFEYNEEEDVWEFFYRDRSDDELYDCEFDTTNLAMSIFSVDKYISRVRL